MSLPKTKKIKVYSIRSSDQPADDGVLPSEKELKIYDINIIKLESTTHNEMDNNANDNQRTEIQNYIFNFLND
jgi:hypothetical protein